jgi:class 3 adenylate cyclase
LFGGSHSERAALFGISEGGPMSILFAATCQGVEIPSGLHTGEVELMDGDGGGIAVHIAARVLENARANELLASRTMKDLVVGSGVKFSEQGTHDLKAIPGDWPLFSVRL